MKITMENYEAFFLDYLEGNLEDDPRNEFLNFIEQNPDLYKELHRFEDFHLTAEKIVFPDKNQLYKSIEGEDIAGQIKMAAFMEDDLEGEECESFKLFIEGNQALKKEYDLFCKARLASDISLRCPDKQKLYKKSGSNFYIKWASGAAAAALILWGMHIIFQTLSRQTMPLSKIEISYVKPEPVSSGNNKEHTIEVHKVEKEVYKAEKRVKPVPVIKTESEKSLQQYKSDLQKTQEIYTDLHPFQERDSNQVIAKLNPVITPIETVSCENILAVSYSGLNEKVKEDNYLTTLEKYVAKRVNNVGRESVLSTNRLIQTGLNVAATLSGNRFGYKEQNGRITSIGFESKLVAFSIPIQKTKH